MKILEIHTDYENKTGPFKFSCLIYGQEYVAYASNLEHMIEKILFKDKHATREDVLSDIKLNFSNEKTIDPLAVVDSESECAKPNYAA